MTVAEPKDLSGFSLAELFRIETENQTAILTEGLLAMEADAGDRQWLESLMRAAHSLKGASRIADREAGVRISHAMEDCFVAAQADKRGIADHRIEWLLRGVDLLTVISRIAEADVAQWEIDHKTEVDTLIQSLTAPPEAPGTPRD